MRMLKMLVTHSVRWIAILVIASLTAVAGDQERTFVTQDGRQLVTSQNGRVIVALDSSAKSVPMQSDLFGSSLSTIHNNFALAYPLGLYWDWQSWTVSGTNGGLGFAISTAMPFTPPANATVKQIVVGVGWISGSKELTISLYSDNAGLPGTSLGDVNVQDPSTVPSCCLVTAGSFDIPITANTQYWVVLGPSSPDSDFFGGWYMSTSNETFQPFSQYINSEWVGQDSGINGAFAVLGTEP